MAAAAPSYGGVVEAEAPPPHYDVTTTGTETIPSDAPPNVTKVVVPQQVVVVIQQPAAVNDSYLDVRQCQREGSFKYTTTLHGFTSKHQSIDDGVLYFNDNRRMQLADDKRSPNCACKILRFIPAILVWVCVSLLLAEYAAGIKIAGLPTRLYLVLGIVGVLAVVAECWSSNTNEYLHNRKDVNAVFETLQQEICKEPVVTWEVECSHEETSTTIDCQGCSTRRNTVETLSRKSECHFVNYKSTSVPLIVDYLRQSPLIKLRVHHVLVFGNSAAEADYYNRAELFRRANDNNDRVQTFTDRVYDGINLAPSKGKDVITHILVADDKESRKCASSVVCCFFTMCMCGACYRCWFNSKAMKLDYILKKEVLL